MLIIFAGILLYLYLRKRKKTAADAYADTLLLLVLFIYITTQIYSVFHLIEKSVILGTWTALLLLLLTLLFLCREKGIAYHKIIDAVKNKEFRKTKIVLAIICTGMLLLSAKSITANWDSMAYHMPRVMHWIQNKSTAFYATNETRQITSPPLSEYVIMHVMLLTGNDKFVCMVQGVCYVLSAGLIYVTAGKMKMEKRYAYLAVFFFLMMPPAVAEAVTTQNDLFTAFIMLLFFYYYLDFVYRPDLAVSKETLILSVKLGMVTALGYLAKSNVLIPMAVFIAYLGILKIWNKEKVKNILVICITGIVTAAAGVCPFLLQSYRVYGSLLPKAQTDGILPETVSIRLLLANCYKNTAKYLSTPLIPGINDFLMKIGRGIEKIFQIDINDAAISAAEFKLPDEAGAYHSDMAANPLVLLLMLLVLIGILCKICSRPKPETGMFVCTVIGLLATCTVSVYSQWKVRYFLPVSAVAVIVVCFFIERIKKEYKWKEYVIGFIICFGVLSGYGAVYYTNDAVAAGYYGNEDGPYSYFVNYKIRGPYNDMKAYIETKGYQTIGLYMQGGSYEYPLWVYLEQAQRIEHVLVADEYLQKLEDASFHPECIISISKGECVLGQELTYHGISYICRYVSAHDAQYAVFAAEK